MSKPFKSERAAKIAMTKAERAYSVAMCEDGSAYRTAMQDETIVDANAYCAAKRAAYEAARDAAQGVYDQAKRQGFYVRSWHFGPNATRDLIAANMD